MQVITKRLPSVQMTVADIQAAHRLQGKSKLIVQFAKRQLRDAVYDGRFELFSRADGQRQHDMAPLYIIDAQQPTGLPSPTGRQKVGERRQDRLRVHPQRSRLL